MNNRRINDGTERSGAFCLIDVDYPRIWIVPLQLAEHAGELVITEGDKTLRLRRVGELVYASGD